jgi:hypothetical protein
VVRPATAKRLDERLDGLAGFGHFLPQNTLFLASLASLASLAAVASLAIVTALAILAAPGPVAAAGEPTMTPGPVCDTTLGGLADRGMLLAAYPDTHDVPRFYQMIGVPFALPAGRRQVIMPIRLRRL